MSAASPAFADTETLLSHRAHYDLTLTTTKIPGANLAGPGLMIFEIAKTCTAWKLQMGMTFKLDLADGKAIQLDSKTKLVESHDGRQLAFAASTRLYGKPIQDFAGTAETTPHGDGRVVMTRPEAKTAQLPRGIRFPIAAYHVMLAEFRAGKRSVEHVVFPGNPPAPMLETDLFLGATRPLAVAPHGDAALIRGESWRIASSLFALDATDAPPIATTVWDLYETGVSSAVELIIGLGTFAGARSSVEELPEPTC